MSGFRNGRIPEVISATVVDPFYLQVAISPNVQYCVSWHRLKETSNFQRIQPGQRWMRGKPSPDLAFDLLGARNASNFSIAGKS